MHFALNPPQRLPPRQAEPPGTRNEDRPGAFSAGRGWLLSGAGAAGGRHRGEADSAAECEATILSWEDKRASLSRGWPPLSLNRSRAARGRLWAPWEANGRRVGATSRRSLRGSGPWISVLMTFTSHGLSCSRLEPPAVSPERSSRKSLLLLPVSSVLVRPRPLPQSQCSCHPAEGQPGPVTALPPTEGATRSLHSSSNFHQQQTHPCVSRTPCLVRGMESGPSQGHTRKTHPGEDKGHAQSDGVSNTCGCLLPMSLSPHVCFTVFSSLFPTISYFLGSKEKRVFHSFSYLAESLEHCRTWCLRNELKNDNALMSLLDEYLFRTYYAPRNWGDGAGTGEGPGWRRWDMACDPGEAEAEGGGGGAGPQVSQRTRTLGPGGGHSGQRREGGRKEEWRKG